MRAVLRTSKSQKAPHHPGSLTLYEGPSNWTAAISQQGQVLLYTCVLAGEARSASGSQYLYMKSEERVLYKYVTFTVTSGTPHILLFFFALWIQVDSCCSNQEIAGKALQNNSNPFQLPKIFIDSFSGLKWQSLIKHEPFMLEWQNPTWRL